MQSKLGSLASIRNTLTFIALLGALMTTKKSVDGPGELATRA